MGREPRVYEPGAIYHLTAHGVDGRPVFVDDVDRQAFVARLSRVVKTHRLFCYGACLMDTHYHLILSSLDGSISPGMRELNGGHSRGFNARHQRRGALFEARYADRRVRDDGHLLETVRYLALNPVRAGMVTRATDWHWSTYAQLVAQREPWPCFQPGRVLALFGAHRPSAIEVVRAFVEERV